MKLKLPLFSLMLISCLCTTAQYQIPLYVPGNTGGQSLNNTNSMLSVIGQNVIGISEDNSNKVYFGILAPLVVITDAEIRDVPTSRLLQNFPNPYRTFTTIPFELSKQLKVKLMVTDILGRPVEVLLDQEMPQGRHHIAFNADGLTPGLYLYQLEVEGHVLIKTMAFTK